MLVWYFVLGACIFISVAQENHNNSVQEVDDDPYYAPLDWSDVFDWKVLTILSEKSPNVLFSPASLKLVLAILYEAASGSTKKDFENGLHFLSKNITREEINETIASLHTSASPDIKVSLSTRIFLDAGITVKESYAKRIKDFFDADVVPANFSDTEATSSKINAWASESTMGAISHMTDPDEVKNMIMLLANALYFKGLWKHPFPKNSTCVAGFYAPQGTKIYVPYMTTTNYFYYYESQVLEARMLRLPYKNSKFSMFFILPFSKGGLPHLIENLNLMDLHREQYYLDKKAVLVSIPKFSFKLKASYVKILQKFGLRKIFQNSASLTGIAEGNSSVLRQLVVSDIIQTTGIEIDEEGSVAYAATDVIIGNKIGVPENKFNASHPFLFFVQDDASGTILFLGKVENPIFQEMELKKQFDDIEKEFPSTTSSGK